MKKLIVLIGLVFLIISCKKEVEPEKEYCSTCYDQKTMYTNQPITDYFCGTLKQVEAFEMRCYNQFPAYVYTCRH